MVNLISFYRLVILIIEIIRKLEKGVKEREINEMSQTPEYSALRDYLSYVFVDYEKQELMKINNLFIIMFNVVPISEKFPFTNSILYEVNNRLLTKQKEVEIEKKRNMEDYETEMEDNKSNVKLNSYFDKSSGDKFKKIFGNIKPEDMVYNVGVPIEEYMKQLIRPQEYKKVLNPPTCLRDSIKLKEPVSAPAEGNTSNVHQFHGIGTKLPKFAFKEVYDPKYY